MSVEAVFLVATETIERGMLVKKTTSNAGAAKLGTGDDAADFFGIALNRATLGQSVAVATVPGEEVMVYADGADQLTEGGSWGPSAAVAGAASGDPAVALGKVMRTAPNTIGALASVVPKGAGGGGGGATTLGSAYVAGGGNVGSNNNLGADGTSMDVPVEMWINNATALYVRDSGGSDGNVALGTGSNGDGQVVVKDKNDGYSVILGGGVDQVIRAQNGETANSVGDSVSIGAGDGTGTQTGGNVQILAGGAEGGTGVLYPTPPKIELGIRSLGDSLEYTLDPDGGGFPILRLKSITSSYIQWGANMVIRAGAGIIIPYTADVYSLGYTNRFFRTIFSRFFPTKVGASLASAATIAPTDGIHPLTGTTPITTITVPSDFTSGTIIFIPNAAAVFNTGGNIGAALTATANVPVHATYDGTSWWLK